MIKLVFFDMAGTVIDENNIVYRTLYEVILQFRFQVTYDDVILHGAGKEKYQALSDILLRQPKPCSIEVQQNIYKEFLIKLEEAYSIFEVRPMEFALDVIYELRQKKTLVALSTGYNRTTATFLLEKLGWVKHKEYDLLLTASDVNKSRPAPDMIKKGMQLLAIKDSKYVAKVGDSTIDILEGKNAECGITVGVTTGAHNEAQLLLANPDYILTSLQFLPNLLR